MTPEDYAKDQFAKMAFAKALSAIGVHEKARGLYLAAYSLARDCPNEIQAKRRLRNAGLPIDALTIQPPEIKDLSSHIDGQWKCFTCNIGGERHELIVPENAYDLP